MATLLVILEIWRLVAVEARELESEHDAPLVC